MFKKSLPIRLALALILMALAQLAIAAPVLIGPGASYPGAGNPDGNNNRVNIDRTGTLFTASTYYVTQFEYLLHDDTAGDIQAFLAIQTGGNSFQTIWTSDVINVAAAGQQITSYANQMITLATDTTLFAGFSQNDVNVLFASGGSTYHHSTTGVVIDGQTFSGSPHGYISRTYAAGLTLNGDAPAPVPEPSIIALFGLGLVGIGFARRKRQS
jgi:hypothetical protein